MQACTGISTCAVLAPLLRKDFCPRHRNCLSIARHIAVYHEAMASGYMSASVDVPVCSMSVLYPAFFEKGARVHMDNEGAEVQQEHLCVVMPMNQACRCTREFTVPWAAHSQSLRQSTYGCTNGGAKAIICNCGIWSLLGKYTKCYNRSRTWDMFSVPFTKKKKLVVLL